MMLDELLDDLAAMVEREQADVVRGLQDSWNPNEGTLDGHWVFELETRLLTLLARFPDADKIAACNEHADAEGLSRLDADDKEVDFWIHQSFIDPVIDRLVETTVPNRTTPTDP